MLINNFKYSGGAKDAVNYVMSMYDHEGNIRSVEPKILEGDPELTKQICLDFCSDFSHKCVSGVISFKDDEHPTHEQKLMVIGEFKKKFLGEMESRINILFIEHNDKSNCEIHYILNRVDLGDTSEISEKLGNSGKYFNPFPPGPETKEAMKLFSSAMNFELGYEQVEEKLFATKYTADERKCLAKEIHGIKNLKGKKEINQKLQKLVKSGAVKNRGELLNFLRDNNYKISRISEDFISIENPEGGRNIRFKGGIYEKNNGLDYSEVLKNSVDKPKMTKEETLKKLDEFVAKRAEFNAKRYKVKIPKNSNKDINKKSEKSESSPGGSNHIAIPRSKPLEAPRTAVEPSSRPVPSPTTSKTEKPSVDSPSPIGGNSVNSGLVSAQSAYDSALARLSSAKTYAERVKAQIELIRAKIALDNAQSADLEQKNKTKVKI